MKKTIIILIICLIVNITGLAQNTQTSDEGVVINGVCWATRNVDTPGTFAANPKDSGMYYQWNRKKAWNPTYNIYTNWDSSTPEGKEWEKVNDPSPEGWRLPTLNEIKSLLNTEKVTSEWTTQGGVNGRKFTDITTGNTLFLPAAGYRDNPSGTLNDAGVYGGYWSSTQDGSNYACGLNIYENSADWYGAAQYAGISLRCVAE